MVAGPPPPLRGCLPRNAGEAYVGSAPYVSAYGVSPGTAMTMERSVGFPYSSVKPTFSVT